MPEDKGIQIITTHHEARRDYFIDETYEAGIALVGCEVKSLRDGQANLRGSFARLDGEELFLYNLHITPYAMGNRENPDPLRVRKLLLHRSQIHRLKTKTQERGFVLVPLKIYFNARGIAKVEIGLGKGKKFYDKRTDIKKREISRELDRAVKNRNRGRQASI